MEHFSERIRNDAQVLQSLSEELCEQLEDTREELREEIEEAEWRWHHLENRLASLGGRVRQPARDVVRAVDTVTDELCDTFGELRRLWK